MVASVTGHFNALLLADFFLQFFSWITFWHASKFYLIWYSIIYTSNILEIFQSKNLAPSIVLLFPCSVNYTRLGYSIQFSIVTRRSQCILWYWIYLAVQKKPQFSEITIRLLSFIIWLYRHCYCFLRVAKDKFKLQQLFKGNGKIFP